MGIYTRVIKNLDETNELARRIGQGLKGGEVIQLVGDVGAGKTTFVKGIVAGSGSKDHVSSPTFTICNTYSGKPVIHHCDFYRLQDDSLIEHEAAELMASDTVLILEWAEHTNLLRTVDQIIITISPQPDDSRLFEMTIPDTYNYLLP